MRSMTGWTSTSTVTGATAPRDRPAGRSRIGRIAAAGVTALLAGTLVPGAMAPASGAVVSAPVAANGFPAFFDDGAVKLGLGPVVDGEAFYFNATASGGKLEVYEAALEGTYTTAPAVTAGQEIAFSRVRFRVTASMQARPTRSPTRMASTPSSPQLMRGASTRPLTTGASPRRATSPLRARASLAITQPTPAF